MNIVIKIGTPIHQYQSLRSITFHNSTKIGGETPTSQRVKKKSSPSLIPSHCSSSSPDYSPGQFVKKTLNFPNYFKQNYPAAVAECKAVHK